jgi:cation transport ATPase
MRRSLARRAIRCPARVFFDSWYGLLRVLVVGTCAYVALVVLLRISGKRTLAKMNAFDLVVTVALGSTLASILLSAQVALVEGVLALALLIGLQFAVAWSSQRSARIRHLVRSEPALLAHGGELLESNLRRERLTRVSIGIKVIFLFLVLFGMGSMWLAVLADMGTSLLVTLNGVRLLKNPSMTGS